MSEERSAVNQIAKAIAIYYNFNYKSKEQRETRYENIRFNLQTLFDGQYVVCPDYSDVHEINPSAPDLIFIVTHTTDGNWRLTPYSRLTSLLVDSSNLLDKYDFN